MAKVDQHLVGDTVPRPRAGVKRLTIFSSCPGWSRASTSWKLVETKGMDGRVEPGRLGDDGRIHREAKKERM
jgi:hypothetical protein